MTLKEILNMVAGDSGREAEERNAAARLLDVLDPAPADVATETQGEESGAGHAAA